MTKWMLVGLLMLMPWGSAARAGDYNADQCQAFCHNSDPKFTVPAGASCQMTLDMTQCGGCIQNYQIILMGTKKDAPCATLKVLDQAGHSVGISDPSHRMVYIGNVPADAVYTVVVTSGMKRDESCFLYYTGSI